LARRSIEDVLRGLGARAHLHSAAALTDGELLEHYLAGRDEAAFEALLRRHGPMVLAVCRRVAANAQDAEDAFQATFLVLVRKAASIWPRHKVGNWLYGVAYRAGMKVRTMTYRQRTRERPMNPLPEPATIESTLRDDLPGMLDRELLALPEKFRLPIVLCDLEGKTRKEAARTLNWPEGTVAGRLAQARTLLAKRLKKHGLLVSGGVLAAWFAQQAVAASLPANLASATVVALSAPSVGLAATGAVSARVAALTEGVLKTMLISKFKSVSILVLVLATLTAGGTAVVSAVTDHNKQAVREARAERPDDLDKPAVNLARPDRREPLKELDEAEAERRALSVIEKLDPRDIFRDPKIAGNPIVTIHVPGSACSDADLKEIAHLPKLQFLNLTGTRITDDGLAHLAGRQQLQRLFLAKTQITGRGLVHLAALKELQMLKLNGCSNLTDNGLAHLSGLTNLAELNLSDTPITDAGLAHLAGLKNLKFLEIRNTAVSDGAVAKLRRALPQLNVVR
jgi:RNA polymerase sigma factor (sigma-70 family)